MTRLDELTDINLKLLCKSKTGMSWLHFVDSDGQQLVGQIREQLVEYMAEKNLVKINGENCFLDLKHEHICKDGWLNHLSSKEDGKFEKYTLKVLENLGNGEKVMITKSQTKEVQDILKKLKNTEIIEFSKQGVHLPLKKRKYLNKLIELESWADFQNWYDKQADYENITYVINSNNGIINQSSNFKKSHQTVKTNDNPITDNFLKKLWKLISENPLISTILAALILYAIKVIFKIEL